MKKYFAALACLLGTLLNAHATPPTDQSIEQMMNVMQTEKMLNQMVAQMTAAMPKGIEQGLQQSLHGKAITPEQKAKVDAFQKKLMAMFLEELSYAKTKDLYLQVYRETFTQEEVASIIAFYSTPGGRAMVEKMPAVMQKASALMQARLGPFAQKMQALMEDFAKDLDPKK